MAASSAIVAYGTTLTRGGTVVAELNGISPPKLALETQDVTHLTSDNSYREYIGTVLDGGDVNIGGNLLVGDAGQVGLITDMEAKTIQDFIITFPSTVTATWTFKALVTGFEVGELLLDGKVSFTATLKVSGKPTLAVTASNNLSALSVSGAGTVLVPVFAAATYSYVVNIATGVATVTITPTAAAGVITVTANGAAQVVATTQASSAITLGAAGSVVEATVDVQETGKTRKRYTLYLTRAAS